MDEAQRFLELADLLPDALLLVTREGVILAANRGVRSRLEMSPEALRGCRLAEIVTDPPDTVARSLRDWSRTRQLLPGSLTVLRNGASGIVCRAEGALYRPAGGDGGHEALLMLRLQPKEASVYQFLLLNQRIEALNGEIARRRRTESELREQREWLRVTLESIGDAVIATDMDGHVTFLNPVAEELTGWRAVEAVGRPLPEVFHIVNEETRRPAENPVSKVLREGTTAGLANHTILISRSGLEVPIDDCAAPILGNQGELLGVVMVFHDVIERRKLERELSLRAARLAEADRRKDEFLAMLAHELRNPLAPIRNALHLLGVPDASPAALRRAREMMERQVQHMVRLVDDLLDVSRITRGKVQLRLEQVEVSSLIQRAAEAVRPHMETKRHVFTVSLPAEPVILHADPTRLDQVLLNLLSNAAKFTDPGGCIELTASRDRDGVRISVRDTGIGIDTELLPLIFEPFMQADQSLDRSQGGLGVGLTLARTLVEMHGGTLTAFSEGPGRGSELVVWLPARWQAMESPDNERGAGDLPSDSSGRRVLVVDDNRDSAESVALLMQIWGYDVRVANDGPSALEIAGSYRPEVVLLDIGLPGMDGYEVARQLRQGQGSSVVLVAMTGYGMEEDRRRSRESGFDHHLVKPVDPEGLRALLAGL
ncbi:MAG TPA: ATP-binding protein [Thermoanaerobaculia bacterium]|nr:ATP-binding protein [Thermoanaerobaculia bacterium]